jgi:hypothetical protein
MQTIEVIDSAIKIGLGALIAGIFALVGSWLAHRREADREIVEYRRGLLTKAVNDCLELHLQVTSYENQIGLYKIRDAIIPNIHKIQTSLILAGDPPSLVAFQEYSSALLEATTIVSANPLQEEEIAKQIKNRIFKIAVAKKNFDYAVSRAVRSI